MESLVWNTRKKIMGKIYATREDDGKRILIELQCDACASKIKPNPNINKSDWSVVGSNNGPGTDEIIKYYCDRCSINR